MQNDKRANLVGRVNVGFTIVAQKPYSNHVEDVYLSVCLGERDGREDRSRFVVWTHNNSPAPGFFATGDYFHDGAEALEAFNKRGRIIGHRGDADGFGPLEQPGRLGEVAPVGGTLLATLGDGEPA